MLFHLYDGKELKCVSKKEMPNVFYMLNTKTGISTSWSGYKPEILKIEKIIKGEKISFCYDFSGYDGEEEYEISGNFVIEKFEQEIFFSKEKHCNKKILKLIYEENKKYFYDRVVVEVKIHEYDDKVYTYYCEDMDIKVGSKVMNTTGAIGVIVKVKELYSSDFVEELPYNFTLKRVWEIDEHKYKILLDEIRDPYVFKPSGTRAYCSLENSDLVICKIENKIYHFVTSNKNQLLETIKRLYENYSKANKEKKDILRYWQIYDSDFPGEEMDVFDYLSYAIERFYKLGKSLNIKISEIIL